MPLYEYRCEACGEKEERLESYAASEQHDCPECGASNGMKRQMSVAAFALSGGGWYKQGYGEAAKAEAKSEAKSEAPSGGGCCGGSCACAAKSS